MRLQETGAVGAGIDVNQRIALTYDLALRIVDGNDLTIYLAGNRIGVDGSHRADLVQVNADVPRLGGRGCDVDLLWCGRCFFLAFVVMPH